MRKLEIVFAIALSLLTFYAYASENLEPLELDAVVIEAEKSDGCQQNPDGSAVGALVFLFLGAYFVGFLVGKTDNKIDSTIEEEDIDIE